MSSGNSVKLSIDPISVMIFAKYFNSPWRYQSSNVPTSRSPQEELPQFRTSEKWSDDVFALLRMCGGCEGNDDPGRLGLVSVNPGISSKTH